VQSGLRITTAEPEEAAPPKEGKESFTHPLTTLLSTSASTISVTCIRNSGHAREPWKGKQKSRVWCPPRGLPFPQVRPLVLDLSVGSRDLKDRWVSISSPMESTMSPAPWRGVTWSHKSAMGLINRMLLRLFLPIRGNQTAHKESPHTNPRPMIRTHLTLTLTQS
jgi:hypothetical protein